MCRHRQFKMYVILLVLSAFGVEYAKSDTNINIKVMMTKGTFGHVFQVIKPNVTSLDDGRYHLSYIIGERKEDDKYLARTWLKTPFANVTDPTAFIYYPHCQWAGRIHKIVLQVNQTSDTGTWSILGGGLLDKYIFTVLEGKRTSSLNFTCDIYGLEERDLPSDNE